MDEFFGGDTFENYNLLYEVATFEHFVNHDPQPRKCSEILNCDINKFMFICSQCDAEFENADEYHIHQMLEHQVQKTQADVDLEMWYEKELLDEFLDQQNNLTAPPLKEFYESVDKIIDMDDSNAVMPREVANLDNVCDYLINNNTLNSNNTNNSKAMPMVMSYSDDIQNLDPSFVSLNRELEFSSEDTNTTTSSTATITDPTTAKTKRKKKRTPGQCDVCNRSFNDSYNLRIHKMIHTGEMPFQCEDCGKGFRQYNKLKIHSIIHTNKKPFVCDLCGKGFRFRNYLAIHKRLHTGEKPYKCKLCDEHFHSLHNRRLHVKATHLQPEESFSCTFCGKVLSTKCYLQVHMKRHNNQRDFKCENCEEAFFTVAQLKEHMLTHAAEKPHQCEICQVTFQRKANYAQHVKTHFGAVSGCLACRICNKTFAQNAELFAHMNVHGQ